MSEIIAGVEVPDTAAVPKAVRLVQETTSPLIYHHSRRVYFFGQIHAHRLGIKPDPELLYLAAMFHDTGLTTPFSDAKKHPSKSMGPTTGASSCLSAASRPRPPKRCGRPSPCTPHREFLADGPGDRRHASRRGDRRDRVRSDELHADQVTEILAVHPRGDFKNEFLSAYFDGLKNRPETANGTVNSDVLEHFFPGFQRTTTVERMLGSAWPS